MVSFGNSKHSVWRFVRLLGMSIYYQCILNCLQRRSVILTHMFYFYRSALSVVQVSSSLLKFLIYLFIMIKKPLEQLHAQSWIQTSGRRSDTVHTQLRNPGINCSATQARAGHRSDSTSTSTVVADLERLQSAATLVRNSLEEGGADAISRHVAVRIVLDLLVKS